MNICITTVGFPQDIHQVQTLELCTISFPRPGHVLEVHVRHLLSASWYVFSTSPSLTSSSFHLASVFSLPLYNLCYFALSKTLFLQDSQSNPMFPCHSFAESHLPLSNCIQSLVSSPIPCHFPHSTSFPTFSFPTASLPLTRHHLPFPFAGVNMGSICCQQPAATRLA